MPLRKSQITRTTGHPDRYQHCDTIKKTAPPGIPPQYTSPLMLCRYRWRHCGSHRYRRRHRRGEMRASRRAWPSDGSGFRAGGWDGALLTPTRERRSPLAGEHETGSMTAHVITQTRVCSIRRYRQNGNDCLVLPINDQCPVEANFLSRANH